MKLTDLRGKRVRSLDGESFGRVHEIHCENGKVIALMTGPGSFIERMTARQKGRRIDWDCVLKLEPNGILVAPNPPRRRRKR